MIDKPEPEDARTPRFLIMDNTPLSLLGTIEALDWLFEPGCDVMITDMVIAEAIREPGESRDQRRNARAYVAGWLKSNRERITVLATVEGQRYEREMRLWERAGKPDDLRPDWSDRGERSVFSAVQDLKAALAQTEEIVVIMDDRDGRDAVRAVRADIALMGTRTFIRWMAEDFGIESAATAWQVIRMATADTADEGEEEDPVYIRRQ
ncbi:hypothetical protein DTW90_22970 [Neorhizobium sp. P12A]|uniref:hypothetical protein n=1 Tax=Neorhizobium sp. P12A TaxID=2268027 RepID=UPI0011ED2A42|nr:hypothetical protein [Neorhizobium sp. P12A]KAA0695428.1 hypothetical protein DTW90_22970 [Neorhizobium sp. P12A]